jgi:hypothetical protein
MQLDRAHELGPRLFDREALSFTRETAQFSFQTELEKLRLDIVGPIADIKDVMMTVVYQFLQALVDDVNGAVTILKAAWKMGGDVGFLTALFGPLAPLVKGFLTGFAALVDAVEKAGDQHRFAQVLGDLDYLLYGGPNPTAPRSPANQAEFGFDPAGGPPKIPNVGKEIHDMIGVGAAGAINLPLGIGGAVGGIWNWLPGLNAP